MKERVGQWTAHALLEQNEHGGHFDAFVGQSAGQATSAVVVLAGGCFWGVQGVFQHVKGVTNAVSGYAGGSTEQANYSAVSTGSTGHAESVEVAFDPKIVS